MNTNFPSKHPGRNTIFAICLALITIAFLVQTMSPKKTDLGKCQAAQTGYTQKDCKNKATTIVTLRDAGTGRQASARLCQSCATQIVSQLKATLESRHTKRNR